MTPVKYLFIYFAFLAHNICFSQTDQIEKIASQVSIKDLKSNLNYLCSEPLEGRLTATHGDTLASMFIAETFRKNNLKGYTLENSVTCCKQCNFVKHTLSLEELIEWINLVHKNLNLCQ